MLAPMLVALRYLLDRLSGPRTRADELRDLRMRLHALRRSSRGSRDLAQLALRLRALREAVVGAMGAVDACSKCVQPRSAPWFGGHCCSGRTRDLFTDDELAALGLSGTTSGKLRAPRGGHAGCAFRGLSGCSLDAAHRPNLCVIYTCRELESELMHCGTERTNARLRQALRESFQQFVAVRHRCLAEEHFAELRATFGAQSSIRTKPDA